MISTCAKYDTCQIPSNAVTDENLNHLSCGDYNRQGRYCSQCKEGYMDLLYFLMMPLVLIALNIDIYGY